MDDEKNQRNYFVQVKCPLVDTATEHTCFVGNNRLMEYVEFYDNLEWKMRYSL